MFRYTIFIQAFIPEPKGIAIPAAFAGRFKKAIISEIKNLSEKLYLLI